MAECKYCGLEQGQQQHYPTLCISLLQDKLEIAEQERARAVQRANNNYDAYKDMRARREKAEQERDEAIRAMTQLQLGAVAERERLEQERNAAQADAAELRRVLGKFRIVISGYKRASESHLPEVDAALNNGKDPLAHLTAKKEASQ